MALAFDATSNSSGTSVTSVTWSHTTSGADRALIVGVSYNDGFDAMPTNTGVTYAGTAMTNVGSTTTSVTVILFGIPRTTYYRAQQWKLSNPASGANNVVVSFDGSVNAYCGAVSFTGAHQTTASLTGPQAAATGSDTAPTVNVASSPIEIAIDTTCRSAANATVGTGQTERWNAGGGTGSTETGATTVTMSWSLDAAAAWALVGVGVRPLPSEVAPSYGLIHLKGNIPATAHVKQPSLGKMLFKGYVPTTAHVKQPLTGKMVYVGHVPTIRTISFTSPTTGQFWFVGKNPNIGEGKNPLPGKLTYLGHVPTVTLFRWVCPDPQVSGWSTVSATAAPWSSVTPPATAWTAVSDTGSGWSTVSATAATWSAITQSSLNWNVAAAASSGWSSVNSPASNWNAANAVSTQWTSAPSLSGSWSANNGPSTTWRPI